MAALLCETCFIPCRQCGTCCDSCGECCMDCCDGFCNAWAACCDKACDALCDLCEHPFSFCGLLSGVVNIFSLAFIAFAVQNWDLACDNPMKEWMVVILVCFIANIAFTVYMWKKLGYLVNGEVPLDENGRELTMRDQACNFFCYDGWVAVYIIVALFAFSWSIVGMAWVADEPSGSPCKEDYQGPVTAAGIVMIVFIILGLIVVICTTSCDHMQFCLEDCDIFKCFFCYIYYPICYRGPTDQYLAEREEKVRKKRLKQRRDLNARRRQRGQDELPLMPRHHNTSLRAAPGEPREHHSGGGAGGMLVGGVVAAAGATVYSAYKSVTTSSASHSSARRTQHSSAPTSRMVARPAARPTARLATPVEAAPSAPPAYNEAISTADVQLEKRPVEYDEPKPAEAKSSAAVTTAKKVGGFASRMFKSGVSKLNSAVNGPEDKKESSPAYAQTRV